MNEYTWWQQEQLKQQQRRGGKNVLFDAAAAAESLRERHPRSIQIAVRCCNKIAITDLQQTLYAKLSDVL